MLCLTLSVDANPYLVAEPIETPDYYVVSINGDAETVSPAINEALMYDLESLGLGKHVISIQAGGNVEGTGDPVEFIVHKVQNKKWTIYTIESDNPDPFGEPMRVRIRTETQRRTGSKKSSGCS
jgi:hypothetical protein